MKFDAVSLLFLFGAIQSSLLLVGLNLNKPFYSDLKKITSLLLLTMTIVMVYYVVVINRIEFIYPYIDSLGTVSWMAIAPLYYLLCRCIIDPRWTLKWKHLSLFPISLIFIVEGGLTILGFPVWIHQFFDSSHQFLDIWMAAFFGSSIYFVGKSILLIHSIKDNKNVELTWFTYLFFSILLIFSIIYLIIRHDFVGTIEYTLILLFELFVFILIYRVFKIIPFQHFFELTKYGNNGLTKDQMETLALQLEVVMEDEKPYLDKKLSLNALSQLSNINKNELSQLLNLYYKSNFYEFVNQHRLSHLEKMILNPDFSQYKITALAEDSGFNSKATFYKAFKEKHQLTPSQFIKKHQH